MTSEQLNRHSAYGLARPGSLQSMGLGAVSLRQFGSLVNWANNPAFQTPEFKPWVDLPASESNQENTATTSPAQTAVQAVEDSAPAVSSNADVPPQSVTEPVEHAVAAAVPESPEPVLATAYVTEPTATPVASVPETVAAEKEALELADREAAAKAQAAKDQLAKEQAAKEQAAKELAAKELAAKELAAKEQAAKEQAAQELAAKEQAAKEQAANEQAAKEQAVKDEVAKELAAKELAAKELAEQKAAQDQIAQAAKAQAAKEQAAREQAAREQTAVKQAIHSREANEGSATVPAPASQPNARAMPHARAEALPGKSDPAFIAPRLTSTPGLRPASLRTEDGDMAEYLSKLERLVLELNIELGRRHDRTAAATPLEELTQRIIELNLENLALKEQLQLSQESH